MLYLIALSVLSSFFFLSALCLNAQIAKRTKAIYTEESDNFTKGIYKTVVQIQEGTKMIKYNELNSYVNPQGSFTAVNVAVNNHYYWSHLDTNSGYWVLDHHIDYIVTPSVVPDIKVIVDGPLLESYWEVVALPPWFTGNTSVGKVLANGDRTYTALFGSHVFLVTNPTGLDVYMGFMFNVASPTAPYTPVTFEAGYRVPAYSSSYTSVPKTCAFRDWQTAEAYNPNVLAYGAGIYTAPLLPNLNKVTCVFQADPFTWWQPTQADILKKLELYFQK